MFNAIKNKLGDTSGANIVEFAFMLPFLLLILLGALEMGRALFIRIAVTNAAGAGVHFGAENSDTAFDYAGMQSAAEEDFGGTGGLSLGFKLTDGPQTPCYYYACWDKDGGVEHSQTTCEQNGLSQPDCLGDALLTFVRVDTTVQFQSLFHYPGIPSSFTMNGHAVMRVP